MYRLKGRLEEGQLADLFRGEHVERSTPVLIKLFHARTSDSAYAKSIAQTARQVARVPAPGIAQVLEVGMIGEQLAIVQQDAGRYSLGLALRRLDTREVILPPALALAAVLSLLETLQAAHEGGVVHGALTPGNVRLGEDGALSITDFGARLALQASAALEKSFGARGRSSYRAPEGGAPSVAGDLYSLGAIAYELITLREASTGNAAMSTRGERLPPPSRLVRRLHARIDPILMRALETNPSRRYKSCSELADGIRGFLVDSGGVPPRDDLAKFVAELFPNEVQLSEGPVPFDAPFVLAEVSTRTATDVEAVERPSFSRGKIDERTPTSDGLPVFAADTVPFEPVAPAPPTQVDRPAVIDWEAPPAEEKVAAPLGPTPQAPLVKKRVRVVEDFAALPDAPKAPPPRPPPPRPARTLMTFVVPFKRPGDPSVPSYEALERRGKRQVRAVSFLGTLALFAMLGLVVYGFLRSTSDPKGTLISYLPVPIQRQFFTEQKPLHAAPPKPQVPLQSFDTLHPDKAFHPEGEPVKPPELQQSPPVPKKTPQPVEKSPGCYDAGKGKTGFLTVEPAAGVQISIDGRQACGGATKIPVASGDHTVVVTELKSRERLTQTLRFEAGKTRKLALQVPRR